MLGKTVVDFDSSLWGACSLIQGILLSQGEKYILGQTV